MVFKFSIYTMLVPSRHVNCMFDFGISLCLKKWKYLLVILCDGFWDYSQGDHGWPPLSVDFSMSPASQVI